MAPAAFQLHAAAPAADTPSYGSHNGTLLPGGRTGRFPNQEESFGAREDDWDDPTLAWAAAVVHVSENLVPGSFAKQNES